MDRTVTVSCGNDLSLVIYNSSVITHDCSPALFNSCTATVEEIATLRGIVGPDTPLSEPPRDIYSFSHFAALVHYTQSLDEDMEDVCAAVLPVWLASEFIHVQNSYLATGELDGSAMYDIENDVLFCKALAKMNTLLQSGKDWFIRLDDCSPSDSDEQEVPISSIGELVLCLCISDRAGGDFEAHILDDKPINLFLHAWDLKISRGVECRCFVPPCTDTKPTRITAISQRHWRVPLPKSRSPLRKVVHDAVGFSTLCILRKILAVATEKGIVEGLGRWGFSFDIVVLGAGSAALVAVKPFGARGGCGSCLFHWVRDGELLYGGKKGVEVRVMTD